MVERDKKRAKQAIRHIKIYLTSQNCAMIKVQVWFSFLEENLMSQKRRDKSNRILRDGEYQRKDGRYRCRYIDENGKEQNVYSWRPDVKDPVPREKGKGIP